jgi:hypothetical protein
MLCGRPSGSDATSVYHIVSLRRLPGDSREILYPQETVMVKSLFVLCTAFLVAACSVTTAPSSDLITATPESSALDLRNNSPDPVFYFVADRGVLALVDFSMCNEPSKCDSIAPGSARKVPYERMLGYSRTTQELVVYHWRLVPKSTGGYEQDSLRQMIVRVK